MEGCLITVCLSMNILFAHLIAVVVADLVVANADLVVAVASVVVVHYVDPFLYVFFGNLQIQFQQSFLLIFSNRFKMQLNIFAGPELARIC